VKSRAFVFTLLEDVVFSARAATEGGHRGLDRIPGSTLLGAAAQRLYGRLNSADRWTVFHSGRLRFADALPFTSTGAVGFPVPACWRQEKHASVVTEGGKLDPQRIWNELHRPPPESAVFFSVRTPYVGVDGSLARPKRRLRMKTAIDKSRGRAREAALFGYDALEAGQRFLGGITADQEVDERLFDDVCDAIGGILRLGRSRGAEYGAVEGTLSDPAGFEYAPRPGAPVLPDGTVLWLLSDLVLDGRDAARLPELTLADLHPDLAGTSGRLVASRSSFTTRRIAASNGFLGRPERDRAAIAAGSVLVFEEVDGQALLDVVGGGLGLDVQCGFGRVWVDPPLLAGERPVFEPTSSPPKAPDETKEAASAEHVTMYGQDLRTFLEGRRRVRSGREETEAIARAWREELRKLYCNGRNFAGKTVGDPHGPGRSQWGLVMDAARAAGTPDDMKKDLEKICKKDDPDWKIQVGLTELTEGEPQPVTLRDWLFSRIEKAAARDADPVRALGILASEARAEAEDWRHGRFGSEGRCPSNATSRSPA